MSGAVEVSRVEGRPRWRLGWCAACSDGYRGPAGRVEEWVARHLAERHAGEG